MVQGRVQCSRRRTAILSDHTPAFLVGRLDLCFIGFFVARWGTCHGIDSSMCRDVLVWYRLIDNFRGGARALLSLFVIFGSLLGPFYFGKYRHGDDGKD